MPKLLLAGCVLASFTAVSAQSPLTTNFLGGTSLAAPAVFFFDLTVNAPITITQIDINTTAVATTTGSIDVFTTPNTYVGNDTNIAAWTLQNSGNLVSAGSNVPTPVPLNGFTLVPGNYGIAIQYNNVGPNYGCCTTTTYSNSELTLVSGGSASGVLGTAICCTPRDWNGSIHYVPSGSGTVATRTNFGTGCYDTRASFSQEFPLNTFDLAGSASQVNTIMMLYTGTGYLVTPGQSSWFTPVSANLVLGDDVVSAAQPLPFTLPYPGGSTSSVWISSNGFVWLEASTNAACCTGSRALLLSDLARICPLWMDMDPRTVGSITFDVDPSNTAAYVTFTGVPEYAQAANLNTFQVAFFNTGMIELRYQACATLGHTMLVGFSPGHGALDGGNLDLSTAILLPLITGPDQRGLRMDAGSRPLIGTSVALNTTLVPASSPFGATLVGLAGFNPGIDLSALGMAGCFQYSSPDMVSVFVPVGGAASTSISLPNNPGFLGRHLFSQSIAFAPGANALGVVSSNGVDLGIGNL